MMRREASFLPLLECVRAHEYAAIEDCLRLRLLSGATELTASPMQHIEVQH